MRERRFASIVISAGALFFAAAPALAFEVLAQAELVLPEKQEERIEGLDWKTRSLDVVLVREGFDPRPKVMLNGSFRREGWNLISSSQWLLKAGVADPSFEFTVPLAGDVTPIEFMAVGPLGELEIEKVLIRIEGLKDKLDGMKDKPPRVHFVMGSLGLSSISYSETRNPDYSAIALTAKVAWQYLVLPPHWDLALAGYFTALPISDNRADATARFLGLNLRFGYVLPFVKTPWRVSILAGSYFTTMMVTDQAFGFRNMSGPQLFPNVQRKLNNGDLLAGYFKFSPMMSGLKVLPLGNRELAVGASWTRWLKSGHPFSVSADLANFSLNINQVEISSSSMTLSAGYGF